MMKKKRFQRAAAFLLTACMMVTAVPVTALAAQTVTTTPGNTKLNVEYFNSTLYNWNEGEANKATKEADFKSNVVQSGKPTISQIQNGNYYLDQALTSKVTVNHVEKDTYQLISFSTKNYSTLYNNRSNCYYKDGTNYYKVTVTRSSSVGSYNYSASYTKNGGTVSIFSNKRGSSTFTENYYSLSTTTSYWLEVNGGRVEDITYTSTNAAVITTLYYAGSGAQQGKGFYFTDTAAGKPTDQYIPSFSRWSGSAQNYHIYSGLVEKKLSDSNNAPFSNTNVNSAKLFATDGSNTTYTSVYKNVKVPFIYNEETGYYELNSDKNAVYFSNGTAENDVTMTIADKPVAFRNSSGNVPTTGYQPFEKVGTGTASGAIDSAKQSVSAYALADNNPTYGFGMVTEVPFQMTDNGKDANGNDIQFEFSGDDDVWVYVDGILALDLGGTHDAIRGTINFATGAVTLNAPGYNSIGDKAVHHNDQATGWTSCTQDQSTLSQQNLYEALETTLTGFAAKGQHTLKVYYMDRGQGKTNCLIRFNLPQKDTVSVTKKIDEKYSNTGTQIPSDVLSSLNNTDFTFTLYKDNQIVPNKNYSLYNADGKLVGNGSTDISGTFKLKNGQTATFRNISLDDNQSWNVVEAKPSERWTAGWEQTSNVNGAKIGEANGFTSGIVTVDGSETATDTISFICTNSYYYVSGLDLDVHDESIVIDYGLPVEVDVLKNDVITGGSFERIAIKEGTSAAHGTVEIKDNKLVYRLTEELHEIDTVKYDVTVKDTTDGQTLTKTGTLTIIPATSMYYEENFSNMITYSQGAITWEDVSDNKTYGSYQETGFVGDTEDHTYGTDAVYLSNLGDSYGRSKRAVAVDKGAQFEYDFTGTGTAIYGRISPDTGYIQVTVTNKETSKSEVQYIDTRVIGDVATEENLYNIPIYNNDSLDYGNYYVRVYLYKKGTPTSAGGSGAEFYLDGIRVYQPMGASEADGAEDYEKAQSAYASDGEANLALVNIRGKVVSDEEEGISEDVITLTDIEDKIVTIEDYNSIGPNEELYLTEGDYKVSFALVDWDTKDYKLYLGMKAPSGSTATVQIGTKTFELNNSADCYYDISEAVQVTTGADGRNYGFVRISCQNGLASLTNIKVTGMEEFHLIPGKDVSGDTVEGSRVLYMTTCATALELLESKEELPEVQVFAPAKADLSCKFQKNKQTATVNAKVSADVVSVTVDGIEMNRKSGGGTQIFEYTFDGAAADTVYEVICYNADGIASEVYTVSTK